jgi:NADPH-dependent curcumin reductase CurA
MPEINRQWLLASRPAGEFDESAFEMIETPMPQPGADEILVHNIWLSVDPYMRGRMKDTKNYVAPQALGAVMEGGTVGEVIQSNNPAFAVGDIIEERLGWQDYAVTSGKQARKIDPAIAPVSTAVGVLGMPGITAYFGTTRVMEVSDGDTVVVSAASGAVGSQVGQIARIRGARRVIGIAGGAEKCAYCVDELGFDACLDYRQYGEDSAAFGAALQQACPDGIDCYFENVGGWIGDAIYSLINFKARIAICGLISEYNWEVPQPGARIQRALLTNRARVQGFIVFDFIDDYGTALKEMSGWLREGKLKYREDIVEGLENAPTALTRLFRSQNFGKQLVRIRPDPK